MSATKKASSKPKWALFIGGTAVVALAAGVIIQAVRAQQADAGVESQPRSAEQPGTAQVPAPSGTPKHLGRVNGELIPYGVVAQECFDREGKAVLENVINRLIIQQACQERGISVSETEVNQEVVRIAQRFGLAVENWYQMLEAERNLSPQQYRRDVIWPMLALKKLAGDNVAVAEEDLRKAFIRDYGPRAKARMIMLDNQRLATKVWEQAVANSDDFTKLVREHSIDPASRPLDGAIPPIRRFAGNDTLEAAAFKLKEGDVSGVVQVGLGRYVILLGEGRTEQTVEYDEVKEELYKHLQEEKAQESIAKVFKQLKEQARIDNYLTNTTTGGVHQTSGTPSFSTGAEPAAASRNAAPSPTGRR